MHGWLNIGASNANISRDDRLLHDDENVPLLGQQNQGGGGDPLDAYFIHDGNISDVREALNQTMARDVPWFNGSRKRLLTFWLPFWVLGAVIVIPVAMRTLRIPSGVVKEKSLSIYYSGICLQYFLLFMVARDLLFMLYWFINGDFLGFWKNIVWHIFSVPLDCFVLLVLGSWGAIVMN